MWNPPGFSPLREYRPADVQRRLAAGEISVLDVREPDEWRAGHIAGAHWIPLDDLEVRFGELDKSREWVCVCHLGQRSAVAVGLLTEEGFRAANLAGGMAAWEQQGLPTEDGPATAPR